MSKQKKTTGKSSDLRILVTEDHAIVREGFVSLINQVDGFLVCAEAECSQSTLSAIENEHPDILILDLVLNGEDGIELLKQIRAIQPKLPVLVISMRDEEIYAERAVRAGANGYIMKNQAANEFVQAIHAVMNDEIYLSRKMTVRLLHRMVKKPSDKGIESNPVDTLSDRELHVFQMIGSGLPTRKIAKDLGISPKTVDTYRENIKRKLTLKDAQHLYKAASDYVQSRDL